MKTLASTRSMSCRLSHDICLQADQEAALARDAGALAEVRREAEAQRQHLEAQLAQLRKQLSVLQVGPYSPEMGSSPCHGAQALSSSARSLSSSQAPDACAQPAMCWAA